MSVLVEQENFTNLTFVGEDLIFTAERVGRYTVILCSHFLSECMEYARQLFLL